MYLRPTTPAEILRHIRELNPNQRVGSDGVDAKFVVIAAKVIAPCFHYDIFPSRLKIAKIVPIYKAGDKTNLTNYRPISMLSCFSKLLEKIVQKQIDVLFYAIIYPT